MLTKLKRAVRRAMLSAEARRVLDERLTMLGMAKLQRLEGTLRSVTRAGVAGDAVELGMALGGSGILIARGALAAGRAFHGFDVFGMIPPPDAEKDDPGSLARYEEIASGRSPGIAGDTYYGYVPHLFDVVSASFARHGVPVDGVRVALHKGLFDETVPAAMPARVCFAHIDCDWYDPTRFCLEQLADRVPSGGVIVVDDYNAYGGSRRATDEFLAARPDYRLDHGDNVMLFRR
jgi:asparagine synthase (glutamine-hydrolysing)